MCLWFVNDMYDAARWENFQESRGYHIINVA